MSLLCFLLSLLSYWHYSSCLSWIRCFSWWFSKLNKQWRLNKETCNEANPSRIQKIVSFFLSLVNADWTHKPDFQFMLQRKVVSVFKWANVFLLPSATCNLHIQPFKSSFFYLWHWIITESKVTFDLWRCLCCPSSFCNDDSIFPVIWLISSWVFDLFWSDTDLLLQSRFNVEYGFPWWYTPWKKNQLLDTRESELSTISFCDTSNMRVWQGVWSI